MSRRSNRTTPRGFTLIELLVVIAIIGVLIALLLPAVQAAREAARRAQCSNNLKQIGLALSNYENQNGSFPPGSVKFGSGSLIDCTVQRNHTMFALILPFMEQKPIYDSINFNLPAMSNTAPYGKVGPGGAAANSTAYNSTLNSYICPSDSLKSRTPSTPGYSQSSYAGVTGNKDVWHWWYGCPASPSPQIESDGMFNADYTYRVSDVSDGLSNTMFVGETSRFRNDPDGNFFYFWTGDLWYGTATPGVTRITAFATTVAKPNASFWLQETSDSTYYQNWDQNPALPLQNMGQWGFRSQHPGGVNFVFGDGSVRFLKDSISVVGPVNPMTNLLTPGIYRQLATRGGGEVIDQGGL
jgi:prepilin-type N-terminal cleavage/methylation domain-containing protein/prepilin-type processing-associated H-X9-DG protein